MAYLDIRYIASYVAAGLILAAAVGLFRSAVKWAARVNTSMENTALSLALLRQQLEDHVANPVLHNGATRGRTRSVRPGSH